MLAKLKLRTALNDLGYKGLTIDEPNTQPPRQRVITAEEQHKALIENLYISKTLTPSRIWESINIMGGFKNPRQTFSLICTILENAGAFQNDLSKFNAEHVLDNLFAEERFDKQDVQDFLLYWRQFAFARGVKEERNEIKKTDWMKDEKLVAKYVENSYTLGLMTEDKATRESYHETWVMGASQPVQELRTKYLKAKQETRLETGQVRFLAGKRGLTAGLDGKEYMLALAEKLGIAYEASTPTVARPDKKEYLNYTDPKGRRLYESDMVADVYQTHFGTALEAKQLIDSNAIAEKNRPDTISTSMDAADKLIKRLKEGDLKGQTDIHVLVCSNQPFNKRQTMAAQKAIDQKLKASGLKGITITAHAFGPELTSETAKKRVEVLHSDGIGVLGSEQYAALKDTTPKRDSSCLLYQAREKLKDAFKCLNSTIRLFPVPVLSSIVVVNSILYSRNTEREGYVYCNLCNIALSFLSLNFVFEYQKGMQGLQTVYHSMVKEGVCSFVQRVQSANFENSMPQSLAQ
jgi:hypothetical protein